MAKQGSMFRLTIILLIIGIIVVYVFFNTRLLIKGPEIEIYDLYDGQVIEDDLITVRGKASDISFISLDGRQIFIDENQMFNEKVLLTNKINPIEIYAKDKFGKIDIERITLIKKDIEDFDDKVFVGDENSESKNDPETE